MGTKIITVDPRHTWMTTRSQHHLQLRAGTHGAMGMLNVIINQDLYDKAFVEKWVSGFDKLKERVQDYPLEKVSTITGVPARTIEAAATLYACFGFLQDLVKEMEKRPKMVLFAPR